MRITINLADVTVELDDEDSKPTVEGIETLLDRTVNAALSAYKGLADIDGVVFVDEDEEESVTPDED